MNTIQAFRILQLHPNASQKDVKQAFKRLAKQYHPDVCNYDSTAKFQRINNAYQLAYEFLKKSEDSNNGQMRSDLGYFFMGEMFYYGLCVAKDWGKAKDYYKEVMKKYYGGDYYMIACERVASMNAL